MTFDIRPLKMANLWTFGIRPLKTVNCGSLFVALPIKEIAHLQGRGMRTKRTYIGSLNKWECQYDLYLSLYIYRCIILSYMYDVAILEPN